MSEPIIKHDKRVRESIEFFLFSNQIFNSRRGLMEHKHQAHSSLLLTMLQKQVTFRRGCKIVETALNAAPFFLEDWFRE